MNKDGLCCTDQRQISVYFTLNDNLREKYKQVFNSLIEALGYSVTELRSQAIDEFNKMVLGLFDSEEFVELDRNLEYLYKNLTFNITKFMRSVVHIG